MNIKQLVESGKNVVVAGTVVSVTATELSKTTVFPPNDQVLTVEDVAVFRLSDADIQKISGG